MNAHNIKDKDLLKDIKYINDKKQQIADDLKFVNDIQEKYDKERGGRIIKMYGVLSVAAAIVIFFSLFGPSLSKMDYNATYTEYVSLLNSNENTRGSSDTSSALYNAISYYDEKKLDDALKILNNISTSDPSYSKAVFYKSLINLEKNNIEAAKKGFNQCLKYGMADETRAQLGLALSCILDNDPVSAKEHLKILKNNPEKPYHKEVRKLYRSLRFRKTK